MMLRSFVFSSILASAVAAPAVVWRQSNNGDVERFLHSSDEISASKLLDNVLDDKSGGESSLAAVVFLIGRGEDGSESLTELASSGKLPQTSGKYNDADGIFHHVSGIESIKTVVNEVTRANSEHSVLEVSLSEFNNKVEKLRESKVEMEVSENGAQTQSSSKTANRRARHLANADVLVVNVGATGDATALDNAIVNAVENEKIDSVVLSGIRSLSEVKHERYLLSKRRMNRMEQQGQRVLESRRRLEQDDNEDADNGDNNNDDMSGVYYVYMTPNILAAILFGLLFIMVTIIGVSCMGAIAGQDVFVTKLPAIGREA